MRGGTTVGGRPRRGRVRTAIAALMVASCVALGACSGVRQSLGTTDAPCFVALPTATKAVGSGAHLAGVRLMKVKSISYRKLVTILEQEGVRSGQVCLVAFTGHFTSSKVSHPRGRSAGKLAVVVLRYPNGSLVATVLFRHVPVRFSHTHLG